MAELSFRTIAAPAEGWYKEKGSRFLAFAYPVATEEDIKRHMAVLQKTYHDARHHCFAWMLGSDKKLFRAHDAGEPNHSAGDPILGQIRSRDLTNVLVAVVRYFGGTKLGIGGLITAYKLAASEALDNATIVERDVEETVSISYDYSATPEVMRLIKEFDMVIETQSFKETCFIVLRCKLKNAETVLNKVALMKALGQIREYANPGRSS